MLAVPPLLPAESRSLCQVRASCRYLPSLLTGKVSVTTYHPDSGIQRAAPRRTSAYTVYQALILPWLSVTTAIYLLFLFITFRNEIIYNLPHIATIFKHFFVSLLQSFTLSHGLCFA